MTRHETGVPALVRLLAVASAVVLLADVPGAFTRGDVLRAVVFAFVAAGALAISAWEARGARIGGGTAVLWLPALVPLPALLAAVDPALPDILRGGAVWWSAAALAWAFATAWRGSRDVRFTARILVGAGLLAALWTVLDGLARRGVGVGPFGRPGLAGPILAVLLVLGVGLSQPVGRAARVLGVLLFLAAIVVTGSRTAAVALAAGALVLAAGLAGARVRRVAIAAGLVLAIGGAVFAGLAYRGAVQVEERSPTLAVRVGLHRAALHLLAERPWTGHGLGAFPGEVLRVRDETEARISRGRRPMVAHNDLLHVGSEGGWPAMLVLAGFFAAVAVAGIAAWRRLAGEDRRLTASLLAAFTTLVVASFGEDVLLDAGGALLAAFPAAGLITLRCVPREEEASPRVRWAWLLLAIPCFAAAATLARDALADHDLQRFREAILERADYEASRRATRELLEGGVLAWRPDHAEARYLTGVHQSEVGHRPLARERFREAAHVDPGRTESWLRIARTYEEEGRRLDAEAALEEALRRDPTRFDVHMHLGHLALGDEPVPGEKPGEDFDPVAALRHYNRAAALASDRFEVPVAYARIARRRDDLEGAGAYLREARALAGDRGELLLESFRLAEAEGQVADIGAAGILALALTAQPALDRVVAAEAEALLDRAEAREAAAREIARENGTVPDLTAADRAYGAAAVRFAGRLYAGRADLAAALARAEEDAAEGRWRSAFARFRAIASWATRVHPEGRLDAAQLEAVADVLTRTAHAAAHVDAAVSRLLYGRRDLTYGAALMQQGDWDEAAKVLERAATKLEGDPDLQLCLARTYVELGRMDDAEEALIVGLARTPDLGASVLRDPALRSLWARPRVRAAVAGD